MRGFSLPFRNTTRPSLRDSSSSRTGSVTWNGCSNPDPVSYDVAPDGNSFVMMRGTQKVQEVPTLTFVENWVEGLK